MTLVYQRPHAGAVHRAEPRLAEMYEDLDGRHFAGARLPRVPVLVGIPANAVGGADLNGLCRVRRWGRVPVFAAVYLSDWLFGPAWRSEDQRWESIENTLLHEMVHVAHYFSAARHGRDSEPRPHGRAFTAWCNRIGRKAGWETVWEPVWPEGTDWMGDSSAEWPANAR